jgi:mono/diheme cytochrome c family protein
MSKYAAALLVGLLLAGGCSPMGDQDQTRDTGSVDSLDGTHEALGQVAQRDSVWTMPLPALGYNAREGRELFSHYCSVCHGVEGHGDGFNAYNLDPKPRNLADPEFQMSRSDHDLSEIIRLGGVVAGLSTGMPPWGRTINERGINNIVIFLRTLADTLQ